MAVPRLRAHRLGTLAFAILVAVILGVPGAGPAAPASGSVPAPTPRTPISHDAGAPNASTLALLGNIALTNGTYRSGPSGGPNGWAPVSLAYDSLEHRLFIGVAQPSPAILVLSALTGQVSAAWTLPGGPSDAPRGLVFDPFDDRLFSADGVSGNVSSFDATTGALLNRTFLGSGTDPVALALDPVARVITVAESGANSVAFLNDTTGHLLGAVSVGAGPSALAYDPGGLRTVVANQGGSTVTLVDAVNRTVGRSILVGQGPDAVAFDPAGGSVLVANGRSDNVTALDPFNFSSTRSFGTGRGPTGLSVTTDGIAVVLNSKDANVTVYDDSTATPLASEAVGPDPVTSTWDPSEGHIYVAVAGTDSLVELSGTDGSRQGALPLGASPEALVSLGGAGVVAAADTAGSEVAWLNLTNGSEILRTPTAGAPLALAYAPGLDRLYATLGAASAAGANISVLNASTGAVVGDFDGGVRPQGIAYDPGLGRLFVADAGNASVEVLDPSNGTVLDRFPIPPGPHGTNAWDLAVADGQLFVTAGSSNDSVAALDPSDGHPIASIATPADPVAVVADAALGEVWVADRSARELTGIWTVNDTVLANITLPAAPEGLTVDPATGWLLVSGGSAGTLIVLDPAAPSILATLRVGPDPVAVAVDPGSGEVGVADATGGFVAVVGPPPPRYPVRFNESGLAPSGTLWSVIVDGSTTSGTGVALEVPEPNGTHRFVVPNVPGEVPTPGTGSFQVQGRGVGIDLVFGPPTYNATFIEEGLATTTFWWVAVGGQNVSGTNAELTVALANGSYSYTAGTPGAYETVGASGSGKVNISGGAAIPQVVQFRALPPYLVDFVETGLAPGTVWSVQLDAHLQSTNRTTLTFRVASGVHLYQVPAAAGLRPTPSSGSVAVNGADPPPVPLSFAAPPPILYNVTFAAVGLPSEVDLAVTLDGVLGSGPAPIRFREPNGTYPFTVAGIDGLVATPARGNVTVSGAEVSVGLVFRSATIGIGPTPLDRTGLILGAIAATAVALAIGTYVILHRRRRVRRVTAELVRSGPPSPGTPPTDGGPEGTEVERP